MQKSKSLSLVLFVQRTLLSLAFAFLAIGETLHLKAFVQNGIDIGLPYAYPICFAIVILTFIASVMLFVGFKTRLASIANIIATLFSGFFYFAGDFNRLNIIGVFLALALLLGFFILGGGQISLDNYLQNKKEKNNDRIPFR